MGEYPALTLGGSIFAHIVTVNMLRLTPKFFVFLDVSNNFKNPGEKE